jgi:hypothetical protein
MHQIQRHMLNSWRRPQRRPHGAVGFVDSDYIREQLASRLPKSHLSRPITDVPGLPKEFIRKLDAKATIGDVLKLELHRLRARGKIGLEDAIRVRRKLLGFSEESTDTKEASTPPSTRPPGPSRRRK